MKCYHLMLSLLLGACAGDNAAGPGRIEVEWTGADTGQLQVPAIARWCSNDSLVEISGAQGDSGVALAVIPRDSQLAGSFQVDLPQAARPRPSARVALRWPGETLIEGYYGLSGSVTVDSGTGFSGRLEATLRSVNDGDEINVRGVFHELTIITGSAEACGAAPLPATPDSSVQ
jgi:hypothetical protein